MTNNSLNFINKEFVYAIVGASNDSMKPGFKVFEAFLKNNYKAIPINTEEIPINNIQSEPSFPNITSARPFIDAVVIVDADKEKIMDILKEMRDNGVFRIWFFNTEIDEEILNFCQKEKFELYRGENLLSEITV